MCQFSACQPWDERGQKLFQPISQDVAATVRAGWWAYHHGYTHGVSSTSYVVYYDVPSRSLSHLDAVAHTTVPSYDYGYGQEF